MFLKINCIESESYFDIQLAAAVQRSTFQRPKHEEIRDASEGKKIIVHLGT